MRRFDLKQGTRMYVTNKLHLIQALRDLDAKGKGVMTVIVIRHDDFFDRASLGTCPDCAIPGQPNGQHGDWRIAAGEGQGLHGHIFRDRLEFHLDLVDACRNAVRHLAHDTKAVGGAAIGALVVGGIAALAGAKAPAVAAAAAAGAVGCGVVGAYLPARSKRVIELRALNSGISGLVPMEGYVAGRRQL